MAVGSQIPEAFNPHRPEAADDLFPCSDVLFHWEDPHNCPPPFTSQQEEFPQCTAARLTGAAQSICFGLKIQSGVKK